MKTLFPALRVTSLEVSTTFYAALGYDVVGRVTPDSGTRLAMLALPSETEVSVELVERSECRVRAGGLDHLAVQVDDLEATRANLLRAGLRPGVITTPDGSHGPRTVLLDDPDGHRVELVQWPSGHPVGLTRADFADPNRSDTHH